MADKNKDDELDGDTPAGDISDTADESEWEDSTGDEDPEEDF